MEITRNGADGPIVVRTRNRAGKEHNPLAATGVVIAPGGFHAPKSPGGGRGRSSPRVMHEYNGAPPRTTIRMCWWWGGRIPPWRRRWNSGGGGPGDAGGSFTGGKLDRGVKALGPTGHRTTGWAKGGDRSGGGGPGSGEIRPGFGWFFGQRALGHGRGRSTTTGSFAPPPGGGPELRPAVLRSLGVQVVRGDRNPLPRPGQPLAKRPNVRGGLHRPGGHRRRVRPQQRSSYENGRDHGRAIVSQLDGAAGTEIGGSGASQARLRPRGARSSERPGQPPTAATRPLPSNASGKRT